MDDWDFMEFSEILALLNSEILGTPQVFSESSAPVELVAGPQESDSCTCFMDESPSLETLSSPMAYLENICVTELSPQMPEENVELMLAAKPLSSGNNIDKTCISSSQDPILWNPTSPLMSCESGMAGSVVQLSDVNHARISSTSFARASEKEKGKRVEPIITLEDSFVRKGMSVLVNTQGDKAECSFGSSDVNQLMQTSTNFPAFSEVNIAKRQDGLSNGNQLQLLQFGQHPILFPASSSESNARQYENQSMIQHSTLFLPSSRENAPLSFGTHLVCTCHTSAEPFTSSPNGKQTISQNQTSYYTAPLGKGFPVSISGMLDEQFITLPDLIMRDNIPALKTKAKSKTSVKCRLRSKPGLSTNPRSLTEKSRRTRISERLRELQEVVPKSMKGDNIVDILEEATTYVGKLENQLQVLMKRKEKRSKKKSTTSLHHHTGHTRKATKTAKGQEHPGGGFR